MLVQESDASLVSKARAGDRSAFGALYERHHRLVSGIVHNYLSSHTYDQAPDLIHDAFLKAMEKLPLAREDTDFKNWVAKIAVNVTLDWVRKASTRSEKFGGLATDEADDGGLSYAIATQGVTDPEPLPDEHLLAGEQRRLVDELLGTLPEDQALAFRMQAEGANLPEIARHLITPRYAIKSRMFRTRATLAHRILTDPERYGPLDIERAARSLGKKLSAYNQGRNPSPGDAPPLPEGGS